MISGATERIEIQLKPGSNTFGRGAGNDFQIDDASISESHCEILITENKAVVRDLGSTNGTCIDQEPVREGVIRTGQILRLGNVELVFEDRLPVPHPVAQTGDGRLPSVASPRRAGEMVCQNHPALSAVFICGRCHGLYCEACVNSRPVGKTMLRFCPACGGACTLIDSAAGTKARMAASIS